MINIEKSVSAYLSAIVRLGRVGLILILAFGCASLHAVIELGDVGSSRVRTVAKILQIKLDEIKLVD